MLPLKIFIAPNALKECLSPVQAAAAIARGCRRASPKAELTIMPLGDGGDGTAEAMTRALGGKLLHATVRGPLGEPLKARWGWLHPAGQSPLAVLDMAEASGLRHVPARRRNPLKTSTEGTGDLIRVALDRGCRHIILGIGGSATVDAGMGMARALGAKFFDEAGRELRSGGGDLPRLARIDLAGMDPRLKQTSLWVASDVRNPLTGPTGAARAFAPQKGATPSQVKLLEKGLDRFAAVALRDLKKRVAHLPGSGAAGGLGAGLAAFFNAAPQPADILLFPMLKVDKYVRRADLSFTAEGRVDAASALGKGSFALSLMAHRWGKPLYVLAGSLGPGAQKLIGVGAAAVLPIAPATMSREESFRRAAANLAATAERVVREFMVSSSSRDVSTRGPLTSS